MNIKWYGRRALTSYLEYGYIPLEDGVPDAFSAQRNRYHVPEYAYDDFALAQIWQKLWVRRMITRH